MTPEVIAATKLQIWQEIMRQNRYNTVTGTHEPPDAVAAAKEAEDIYKRLCSDKPVPKRKR